MLKLIGAKLTKQPGRVTAFDLQVSPEALEELEPWLQRTNSRIAAWLLAKPK